MRFGVVMGMMGKDIQGDVADLEGRAPLSGEAPIDDRNQGGWRSGLIGKG